MILQSNRNGVTPLHIAASRKDTNILRAVLQAENIYVNTRTNHNLAPLHIAAHKGLIDNVRELLRHPQIDCNAMDVNGDTAAHHAAACRHQDILCLIAERGRFWVPSLKNKSNRTADQESKVNQDLLKSVQHKQASIVGRLLAQKARITLDKYEENALHKACRSCSIKETTVVLCAFTNTNIITLT